MLGASHALLASVPASVAWIRYFSPFVSARLSVWKSMGKARLHELFAKLGVSLDQCRQKWDFVSPSTRSRVVEQLEMYSTEFGLENLQYKSFQRCVGFTKRASAADVVHSVAALLEAGDAGAFWGAYDALLGKDGDTLQRGVELGMRLQRATMAKAVSLIEKRSITSLKHFRYAYLGRSSSAASNSDDVFGQPLALTRLAHFLVEIHRQNSKWVGAKSKPLVLLAERAGDFLVVGVTCPGVAGEGKNYFGGSFKSAAEHSGARVSQSFFEGSVMEVERDDVHRFLESLHFTMDLK